MGSSPWGGFRAGPDSDRPKIQIIAQESGSNLPFQLELIMANFEQLMLLMSQVAPVLDPLMIDVSASANCCLVVMEADLGILIQLDERRNRLFLSSELGAPPPCDLKRFY